MSAAPPLDPIAIPLSGPHLVEASAGTGKTYNITTFFLRLVVEKGLDVSRILVVTFTEAATAELRERVRSRLRTVHDALAWCRGSGGDGYAAWLLDRDEGFRKIAARRLQEAWRNFDEASIFTIHGFCRRMLLENAFESAVPFETELTPDQSDLIDEIARDFWALETYDAPGVWFDALESNGLSLSGTTRLMTQALDDPRMAVVPKVSVPGNFAGDFQKAFESARTLFFAEREEIAALLVSARVFKKGHYTAEDVAARFEKLEDLFRSESVPGKRPLQNLERFTPQSMDKKLLANRQAPSHPFFEQCAALWRVSRRFDDALVDARQRAIAYAIEEHRSRSEARQTQSFSDLLHRLLEALESPSADRLARTLRDRFPAALIDEFQDTDHVQYEIFRRIYAGHDTPWFLIGDPKQSIYGFRGADIHSYLDATEAVEAAGNRHTLTVNYRSDPVVVSALNALYGELGARAFQMDRIAYRPVTPADGSTDRLTGPAGPQPGIRLCYLPRTPSEAEADTNRIDPDFTRRRFPGVVAADISRFLSSGHAIGGHPVSPEDVAVLVPTHAIASKLKEALSALDVPAVVRSRQSVFASAESAALGLLLEALFDPSRDRNILSALATDLFGLSADQILALREDLSGSAFETWVLQFREWNRAWFDRGFMATFRQILSYRSHETARALPARLLACPDGERRLTNLRHLAELLHEAEVVEHLGPAGLLRWFTAQRDDVSQGFETFPMRLESDDKAVKIVTVHAAKGLQFPVVYCPWLWSPGKKVPKSGPMRVYENSWQLWVGPANKERARLHTLATRESRQEALRLLYVALTRARHHCVIHAGPFQEAEKSALHDILFGADTDLDDSDEELLGRLRRLERESSGAIAIDVVDREAPPVTYAPADLSDTPLHCRIARRASPPPRRTASFSALAAGGGDLPLGEAEGMDRDGATEETDAPAPPGPRRGTPISLEGFVKGARAGSCLHAIFEHCDFQDLSDLPDQTAAKLEAFGIDPVRWAGPVTAMVQDVIRTPLGRGPDPLTLDRIPRSARLDELAFLFPAATEGRRLTPARLAGVFSRHPGEALPRTYPARIARLGFAPLRGFLKGFIDLTFEADGRWFVVDYKSNFLGDTVQDYTPSAMARAMTEHDYFLQYHVYGVALMKYLSYRKPRVAWEDLFGGVFYLFLRGMTPETGPRFGVFHDKPAAPLLRDLSRLFDGVDQEGGP